MIYHFDIHIYINIKSGSTQNRLPNTFCEAIIIELIVRPIACALAWPLQKKVHSDWHSNLQFVFLSSFPLTPFSLS